MKIKQIPEDFIVKEISNVKLSNEGKYCIYELKKQNIDSIEAKRIVARKFRIRSNDMGIAGLKDKYACATQLISIKTNKKNKLNFKEKNLSLKFIGLSQHPIKTGSLLKNNFTITVRDIRKDQIENLSSEISLIKRFGIPNYFDSQRFGSVSSSKEFIAKKLIGDDFEGALKIYLTFFTRHASSRIRKFRKIIKENWGNWGRCLELTKNIKAKKDDLKIISFLKDNPKSFVEAFNLIDNYVKEIFVSAYQSYLWNESVKEFLKLKSKSKSKNLLKNLCYSKYNAGFLIFYKELDNEILDLLKNKEFPMIDRKIKIQDPEILEIVNKILSSEKIKQEDLKIKKINLFFKARNRKIILIPENLELKSIEDDELNSRKNHQRFKAVISFNLEKGSYATLIIKRLFQLSIIS